jgi:hypothetical protein
VGRFGVGERGKWADMSRFQPVGCLVGQWDRAVAWWHAVCMFCRRWGDLTTLGRCEFFEQRCSISAHSAFSQSIRAFARFLSGFHDNLARIKWAWQATAEMANA